jgi:hypothetical protein
MIRGIYGAVRDPNWGTVEPRFTSYDVVQGRRGFRIRFTAEHDRGEIGFTWRGEIDAEPNRVRFLMDGEATGTFLANRIGLCVLHPDSMAGAPVSVMTPYGTLRGHFPELIAPVSIFTNIRAIHHPVGTAGRLRLSFAGDLFEMEDQRNWTDASFKTFSTPLSLPVPRLIETTTAIRQEVVATIEARTRPAARHRDSPPPDIDFERVGAGPLPAVGTLSSDLVGRLAQSSIDRVRALGLSHIRVVTDPADGSSDLACQLAEAKALGLPIELDLSTDVDGDGVEETLQAVQAAGIDVARLLVFDRRSYVTTRRQVAVVREVAGRTGIRGLIGGGSRADFAQFNQADVPIEMLDAIAFRVTPQIHATDDESVMETLSGQAAAVRSARAMAGDRPIIVGPVTLRQLFNPVAADPADAVAPANETADPRQATLFGAAWTLGSIATLAASGASAITIHRTIGHGGILPGPEGRTSTVVRPLYHVLADLTCPVAPTRMTVGFAPGTVALGLAWAGNLRLLIANITDDRRDISVRLPAGGETRVRSLDDRSVQIATADPERFRAKMEPLRDSPILGLTLRPWSIATVERIIA